MIKHILKLADDAANGLSNSLEAYIELKKIEKTLEMAIESVKPLAIQEADKYHEKSFELSGVQVTKSRAPGRWDYSEIPQWKKRKDELSQIEALSKDAFKLAAKGQTITDPDGVIVGPARYSEGIDTITIKQPKQ